ncbi:MAG: hypothetical protein ACOCG6_01110, partial [Candidatus Cloacimonadaceae bacterium]
DRCGDILSPRAGINIKPLENCVFLGDRMSPNQAPRAELSNCPATGAATFCRRELESISNQ